MRQIVAEEHSAVVAYQIVVCHTVVRLAALRLSEVCLSVVREMHIVVALMVQIVQMDLSATAALLVQA